MYGTVRRLFAEIGFVTGFRCYTVRWVPAGLPATRFSLYTVMVGSGTASLNSTLEMLSLFLFWHQQQGPSGAFGLTTFSRSSDRAEFL